MEEVETVHHDTKMLADHKKHLDKAANHFAPVSLAEEIEVKGVKFFREIGAADSAYTSYIEMHKDPIYEELPNFAHECSKDRAAVVEKNAIRYNLKEYEPSEKPCYLPFAKVKTKQVVQSIRAAIVSLLTDPRHQGDDNLILHYDPSKTNPFEPPEITKKSFLGDIHTASWYKNTWNKHCTKPNHVLLPIFFTSDKAVSGQFDKMPVEEFRISLGIHPRRIRYQDHGWRTIGNLSSATIVDSVARKRFASTDHMDAKDYASSESEEEEEDSDDEAETPEGAGDFGETPRAQDFHAQLAVILEGLKELQQDGGFAWDLNYKGKNHSIVFHPVVAVGITDTEEHDKYAGHYCSRNKQIKQLCRYCDWTVRTPKLMIQCTSPNTRPRTRSRNSVMPRTWQN
jgi:hypothetical protein